MDLNNGDLGREGGGGGSTRDHRGAALPARADNAPILQKSQLFTGDEQMVAPADAPGALMSRSLRQDVPWELQVGGSDSPLAPGGPQVGTLDICPGISMTKGRHLGPLRLDTDQRAVCLFWSPFILFSPRCRPLLPPGL